MLPYIFNMFSPDLNQQIYVDSSAVCAYVHEHTNIFCKESPSKTIMKYYHKIVNGDIKYGEDIKMSIRELLDLFGSYHNIPVGIYKGVAK